VIARELYVYYRVEQARWRAAADAAAAWQCDLCSTRAGLFARVLRRPDVRDDAVTLMETYAFEPGTGAIDDALQAAIERGAPALGAWRIGARHVEPFDALDSDHDSGHEARDA
jgi:hypothetical protein